MGSPQINLAHPLSEAQKASPGSEPQPSPGAQGLCLSKLQDKQHKQPLSEAGEKAPARNKETDFLTRADKLSSKPLSVF